MPHQYIIWIAFVGIHLSVILRVLVNPQLSANSRLGWLLVIMFLPIMGIASYLLFGEPWLAQRFKKQILSNQSQQRLSSATGLNHPPAATATRIPPRYAAAFATCEGIAKMQTCHFNRATIAANSDESIDSIVKDIHAATTTVHLSFYIWLNDHNGAKVVDAILKAARRGVTCRIVVDAFGSRDMIKSQYWTDMRDAGAKLCASLNPTLSFHMANLSRPDLRNHRKIVVIDNWITYCGSQNCADPQFRIEARFAPWVDIVLRFEGNVARQNQRIFAEDWSIEMKEDLSYLLQEPIPVKSTIGFPAIAFGTGPTSPEGSMTDAFVAILGCAETEVVISTPYFVPDQPLLRAIITAARRGVKTTLILPARNNSRIVAAISSAHYRQLINAEVTIMEYHGGLLHSKTLVVDRYITLIGSANMDYRSLYLNFENNILLYSSYVSKLVRDRQESYIESSTRVSVSKVHDRSIARIALDNLMMVVGPIY